MTKALDLALYANTEVDLDARLAKPVEITPPEPAAKLLPILFVAMGASVLAFVIGVRWRRWRPYAMPAGVLLATIALAAIGIYMIYGFSALLIVAVALLVLAWVERSPLLGVVGTLFTIVSVQANLQGIARYFSIYEQDSRLVVFTDLALPGGVLIIGGVIALLQSRRAAR